MSLQLFGLLFGSYTWTVLTALWADEADETPSKISYAWPCKIQALRGSDAEFELTMRCRFEEPNYESATGRIRMISNDILSFTISDRDAETYMRCLR